MKIAQEGDRGRQSADSRSGASTLTMKIDAEPAQTGIAIGRVGNVRLKVMSQGVRHERRRDGGFNFVACKWMVADWHHLAVHPDASRSVSHQQQIAATPLDELGQPAVKFD